MRAIGEFPAADKRHLKYVLTDIDDTLTLDGRLPAVAYAGLEHLQQAGFRVIPVTGRPAGWCDHIARMWPVDGIIGENGAFYFCYDQASRTMRRAFWDDEKQLRENRLKLSELQKQILRLVPGCRISADQPYRLADLAIDFCEDVEPLPAAEVDKIVELFTAAGAVAKISSIHVNGWFGQYDKLAMTKRFFLEIFGVQLDDCRHSVVFAGDSPNDAPMFGYFPHGVAMANILRFIDVLEHKPAWITKAPGGFGFAELAGVLLAR